MFLYNINSGTTPISSNKTNKNRLLKSSKVNSKKTVQVNTPSVSASKQFKKKITQKNKKFLKQLGLTLKK